MTMLAIGLGLVVFLSALIWLVSLRARDASIVDIFWGPLFAALAWCYWGLQPEIASVRQTLVPVLTTLWAARLSIHIFVRNHGKGEDPRYAAMRRAHGDAFWWRSLFTVFLLQAAIAWFVALPLWRAIDAPGPPFPTWIDGVASVAFGVGLAFETIADRQLAQFRSDAHNRGRVLDTGLWRYSRHPNYFGDALLWWGLFLFAAATPGGWWTIASPIVMTLLLLKVSGVSLLERSLVDTKPGYRDYVARTSAFVPWKPL